MRDVPLPDRLLELRLDETDRPDEAADLDGCALRLPVILGALRALPPRLDDAALPGAMLRPELTPPKLELDVPRLVLVAPLELAVLRLERVAPRLELFVLRVGPAVLRLESAPLRLGAASLERVDPRFVAPDGVDLGAAALGSRRDSPAMPPIAPVDR